MENEVIEKKHRTAKTSIKAFKEILQTDLIPSQHVRTLEAITKFQPVTRRRLSQITGIEIPALCRVLNNAVNTEDPLIKKVFEKPCSITGKTVEWYSLVDWQEVKPQPLTLFQ